MTIIWRDEKIKMTREKLINTFSNLVEIAFISENKARTHDFFVQKFKKFGLHIRADFGGKYANFFNCTIY